MIVYRGKEISAICYKGKLINAVYFMSVLVWQSATSCFGRGYWINTLPWSNTDVWRNE